jgi:hypothetical protein
MATLFDSASLVMIPSGVKEDKLYSIKPTDGSGDFTFSRGSDIEATRVNSSGLIEKARVNNLLQSNSFDTTWTNFNSSETSGQSGYDGTNDAWLLSKSGANGNINQVISVSGVNTLSVYAKAGTDNWVQLRIGSATLHEAFFDLSSGAVGTQSNLIDSNIESVGGGWYRCSVTANVSSGSYIRMYVADADNDTSGSSGTIYIQDAALCHGLIAQDYIETTTTAVVEGLTADLPRLDYSGGASCPSLLLEPSRTNLVTQSEYFGASDWIKLGSGTASAPIVTENYAVSPEGVQNASRLQCDLNGGTTISDQSIIYTTISGSGDTSAFVYAKSNTGSNQTFYLANALNDRINAVATTEWQKFPLNWIASGNGRSLSIGSRGTTGSDDTLDLLIYAAQVEEASYPTSYIPTYGTAANRGRDNASVKDVTSLGVTTGYTLFYELGEFDLNPTTWVVQRNSSGSALYESYGSTAIIKTAAGDVYPFNHGETGTRIKVAVVFDGTNINVFTDGIKRGSWVASTAWSSFGNFDMDNNPVRANWKQLLIFPTALTDAEAIALTTI